MSAIKTTIVVGSGLYVLLWAIALDGATSLIPLLVIPLVLVVMVAGLNWMSSYMNLPARSPKFHKPHDDTDHESTE